MRHFKNPKSTTPSSPNLIQIENIHFVYQPIIDVTTNQPYAYEALIRHNLFDIAPETIINSFFEKGMHRSLWIALLNKTFLAFSTSTTPPCALSLNVCHSFLLKNWFIESLFELMGKYNISGDNLMLEITETQPCLNVNDTIRVLNELKGKGIRIGLDDFGTGYSNLDAMLYFPIDYIKIDGCFVDNFNSPKGIVALEAIVTIARSIGVYIVAERVETKEQSDMLIAMGVQYMQGYYYSKPIDLPSRTSLR